MNPAVIWNLLRRTAVSTVAKQGIKQIRRLFGKNQPESEQKYTLSDVLQASVTCGTLGAMLGIYLYKYQYEQDVQQKDEEVDIKRPMALDEMQNHKALTYGMPASNQVRYFDDYVSFFDYQTGNPKYVVEHISKDTIQDKTSKVSREQSEFYEDSGIDQGFRSKLQAYKNSGYDRGHLVPVDSHRHSQKSVNETFNLSNISPQVGEGFNRAYWMRLERFIKQLALKFDDVYVITGPLFLPKKDENQNYIYEIKTIGDIQNLIMVPTHFFKVVLTETQKNNRNKQTTLGVSDKDSSIVQDIQQAAQEAATINIKDKTYFISAFILPNQKIDPDTPLQDFVYPIQFLQKLTGTKFFPKLQSGQFEFNDRQKYLYSSRKYIDATQNLILPEMLNGMESKEQKSAARKFLTQGDPSQMINSLCTKLKCELQKK